MKLFYKIILMSLVIAVAQANEPAYEGDKDVCTSADFLNKTQLSCVVCGLKKAGRPAPDEHFLGMMGLIAREGTYLFDDEKNPQHPQANTPGKKGISRRSINGSSGLTVNTTAGQVDLTARAQMQKNVIQMLLGSGYCSQGKVKSKMKSGDYKNFIDRMTSDKFAVSGSEDEKIRNKAAKEIGQASFDNAKEEFLLSDENPSYFSLPYDQQQEFYKKRRASNRANDATSYRPNSEIPDCLSDIEQNYAPKYSSAAASYAACTAIYEECEIATYNGSTKRKNAQGKDVRVGGDWCASKYRIPATVKLRGDGTPPAPVEDRSSRPLGASVYQEGDKVIVGPNGPEVDLKKVKYLSNGDIVIPKDAIKSRNSVTGSKPKPEEPQGPAVKVEGQPKATQETPPK